MSLLQVEVQGLDRLRQRLGRPLVREAIEGGIRKAALIAERESRQRSPRDTGALARSIVSKVQPMEARIGTNLVYAPVMEFGRRPGRMPPPQALAGWARRHGFPDTALFVLARAIARKGIRGRFYMRRAAQATKNALPGIMRDVAREIEARFRQ